MKEKFALYVISSIIDKWNKMSLKLQKAQEKLNEVVCENNLKIKKIEEENKNIKAALKRAKTFQENISKIIDG